jgi:multiple sugar transport system substrate-binding protein
MTATNVSIVKTKNKLETHPSLYGKPKRRCNKGGKTMKKTWRFILTGILLSLLSLSLGQGKVQIHWFIGLGTGSDAPQIPIEDEVVARFNASQDKIELIPEYITYDVSKDQLATRIAAGNAPDIVGPVGIEGGHLFPNQWLELTDLIEKNQVDLSGINPSLVEFYKNDGGTSLPYAVYPAFIFYNKALFDEAELPYPPSAFGETYQDKPWDWNTLREIGLELTVDENGLAANEEGFDHTKIVQFGYVQQWTTVLNSLGADFGPGILVDEAGKVQIPPAWQASWQWNYDGMWKDYFIPNNDYLYTDEFGQGNVFNTGGVAMAESHLWYICCLDPAATGKVKDWGVAPMPSYDGQTTSKLNADSFRIMKSSQHPEEAFTAMLYLMQQPELIETYGAFPADERLQAGAMEAINTKFAPVEINWQVITESLNYPDVPSHESALPNYAKAKDTLNKLENKMFSQPDLDLAAEIELLKTDLQRVYDQEP